MFFSPFHAFFHIINWTIKGGKMTEIINNTASTAYSFDDTKTSTVATSNTLPINLQSSSGLNLTKNSNVAEFLAGDIITYSVIINNNSASYLNGVRIIDNLGGGNLAYVTGSATLTTSSQTYSISPIATNPLTFTLQQLAVGSSMTLTYKCQVIFNLPSCVSMITNSVKGIGYPYSGTIVGYANNTIEKKTENDFSITKSSNVSEVLPMEIFNYYLTLSNNTENVANIESITDDLPDNFVLSQVSLKIGLDPNITLGPTEYSVSSGNVLVIPSSSGPTITVPPNSKTVVKITGYFE